MSPVQTTEKGSSAGVGVVDSDGQLGISMVLGGDTILHRAVVQDAGDAFVLGVKAFKSELLLGGGVQQAVLPYIQELLEQISQTAVCYRLHWSFEGKGPRPATSRQT
jgi:hypothetical protein